MRGTHTGTHLFPWSSQHSPCAPPPPPPPSTQSYPSDGVRPPTAPGSLQLASLHTQSPGHTRCGGRRGHCTPARGSLEGTLVKVLLVWSKCGDVTECGARGPPKRRGCPSPFSSRSAVGPSKAEATDKGDGTAKRREEEKRTVGCGGGWQAPHQGPQTPPTSAPDM